MCGGACPNPLIIPFCLESPPLFLELPSYLLGIPPLCCGANSRPLWSLVGCILTAPLFLPIPFSPSPTVPHFKYMSSYDDIAISASQVRYSILKLSLFKKNRHRIAEWTVFQKYVLSIPVHPTCADK
jgi:hypothetical protein